MVYNRTIGVSSADRRVVVVQETADYVAETRIKIENTKHHQKVENDPSAQITKTSNRIVNQLHDKGSSSSWKSIVNDEDVSDAVDETAAQSWTHRCGHIVGMRQQKLGQAFSNDKGYIDDNTQSRALIEPNKVRPHVFYHLPKIHKQIDHPPGRPIVSGTNGPTEKLSRLVDIGLQTPVCNLPSYVHQRYTTHMLHTMQDWNIRSGPFNSQATH